MWRPRVRWAASSPSSPGRGLPRHRHRRRPARWPGSREIGLDDASTGKNENVLKKRLREVAPQGHRRSNFDNVGGDILDAALANLRRGARVVICGAVAGYNDDALPAWPPSAAMSLLVFRTTMTGFVVFDYEDRHPKPSPPSPR